MKISSGHTDLGKIVPNTLVLFTAIFHLWISVANASDTLPVTTPIVTDNVVPTAVQAIWQNDSEGCDVEKENVSDMVNGLRISFSDDHPNDAMYILGCGGPAAYNKPFVIFTHSSESDFARPVILPIMRDDGPGVQVEIYNIKWDNALRQLAAFGKDRGLADCGIKYIWKWPFNTIDSDFILIEQRTKTECDGSQDNFPIVWPR